MALEYLFGTKDDPGLLLAVDANGVSYYQLPDRNVLDQQLREAIEAISRRNQAPQAQQSIYNLAASIIPKELWSKMVEDGVRDLIISPDGLLHDLPFEALKRSEETGPTDYLIKRIAISVVPSFRWWHRMRQGQPQTEPASDLLAIANPVINSSGCKNPSPIVEEILASRSGPDLPALPRTQEESETALGYASRNSISLTRKEANSERFLAAHPETFKIIHFATHALSSNSLDTSLLLFGCGDRMDALTGPQIVDLRLHDQLVVLSACETDVGDTLFGEGNDSLASGFLLAGASCVVATRWRVRDDVPVPIMAAFYDQLSSGDSVDEALRAAKIAYLERDSDPRNWAAFNTLGYGQMRLSLEPTLVQRAERFVINHIILLISLVVIMAIVTWLIRRRFYSARK